MADRKRVRAKVASLADNSADDDDDQLTKGPRFARTVVYVHGIGNKPIPSVLKCQWDTALFGFDLGERSRLAYWVNRAYYPSPDPSTCASGDKTSLEGEPTGTGLSVKQQLGTVTLKDEVEAVATQHTDRKVLLRLATALNATTAETAEISARRVDAKVLGILPGPVREWITRQLVRAFLRDVNDYFYVAERREVMKKSLVDRLEVGGGPFVVVAHSQGTMIAYDVLMGLDPAKYQVPLFVTVGSPLGVGEVQDQIRRLTNQKGQLTKPPCVDKWVNFADVLDPVALDKSLSGEYAPKAAITDQRVRNPDSPKNPHSGSGYLSLAVVRSAVRECTDTALFQRVAPFIIAKDLVRDIENGGDVRHKALIELSSPDNDDHRTIEERRAEVTRILLSSAGRTRSEKAVLGIENLKRYIAANLTRSQTELLAVKGGVHSKSVERIWRNSAKQAYLDVSVDTLQARTAHTGYNARGKGIEWAVLDTGITARHPHFELFDNILFQYNCTKRGPLKHGLAKDEHGHGTHVAGIIAGYYDRIPGDKRVFSSLAPESKLHIYKVLDHNGNGEDAWIIKALDHIADVNDAAGKARIQGVNLSLGGNFDPSVFGCGHSPLCNELRRLWRQGVVVVLAAGNEGYAVLQSEGGAVHANMALSIGDPANLEEAIAVGSVHKERPHTYGVSYFSSRGPTADGRQKPDLVAPGERINSCRHDFRKTGKAADDFYVAMSGTSMAAPHVSGLIASFLSARREFIGYPDTIKELLLASCIDLKRDRPQQGAGMPNLTKMLLNS